jgi:hypothetical protein
MSQLDMVCICSMLPFWLFGYSGRPNAPDQTQSFGHRSRMADVVISLQIDELDGIISRIAQLLR